MDCYQFIQDNFHKFNGKLYRPKVDSNYLVLALMKEEERGLWETLGVKPEAVTREIARNEELLDAAQSHFYVGHPFRLAPEFHVDVTGNVGTLGKLPKPENRNVLTGLVRKTDADYADFCNHAAKTYTMERIPTAINMMDVEYFLPMVGGCIDGYYKVEKVYLGTKNGRPCLKLNLSTFIPLGEDSIPIYRIKMQPGELISHDLMVKLYGKQG